MIQQSRGGDNVAFDHLEDRIVKLVERLDASDSRLGHLEAIERGLADLLVHMQEMRANKEPGDLRAENSGVVELKHDIARTHDVLDALRGTLGHVVDRLGSIEKDIRGDGRARQAFDDEDGSLRMPVGKVAARMVQEPPPEPALRPTVQAYTQVQTQALAQAAQALAQAQYQQAPPQQVAPQPVPQAQPQPQQQPQPQPQPQQQPHPHQPVQRRLPPAGRMPINPDLPPDQPLEPGSGPPQVRANPSARIAASEAALGGTGPQGADAPSGKSGFIAAARRAAKAAVDTAPAARSARIEPAELADIETYDGAEQPSLRGRITKRVKSLFIAASIVAVVVGSVHIAGNVIGFGNSGKTGVKTASTPDAALDLPDAVEIAAAPAVPETAFSPAKPDASWANSLLQPPPPAAAPPAATVAQTPPAAPSPPAQAYPSLLSPPALSAPPQTAAADVTGSIGRAATTTARPASPVAADVPNPRPAPGSLTAAIGGPRLRSAAAAGDAAAAHEVAVRFAEGRGVPANLQEAALLVRARRQQGPGAGAIPLRQHAGEGPGREKGPGPCAAALYRRRRQRQRQGHAQSGGAVCRGHRGQARLRHRCPVVPQGGAARCCRQPVQSRRSRRTRSRHREKPRSTPTSGSRWPPTRATGKRSRSATNSPSIWMRPRWPPPPTTSKPSSPSRSRRKQRRCRNPMAAGTMRRPRQRHKTSRGRGRPMALGALQTNKR